MIKEEITINDLEYEDVEVVDEIEELPSYNGYIKEKRIRIKLGLDGASSIVNHTTDKIVGKLYCVIVDTDKPITLIIRLNEFKGVELFNGTVSGQKYLPLEKETISPDNQKLNFGTTCWYLNDELEIIAKDNTNANIQLVIRYT